MGALTRRVVPNPGPSARSIWGNFLKADPLLHPTEPDFPGKSLRIHIFFKHFPQTILGQRVQSPQPLGGPLRTEGPGVSALLRCCCCCPRHTRSESRSHHSPHLETASSFSAHHSKTQSPLSLQGPLQPGSCPPPQHDLSVWPSCCAQRLKSCPGRSSPSLLSRHLLITQVPVQGLSPLRGLP